MQAMAYIHCSEVTEPYELAEHGNQNRRTRLMPGGREGGLD